MNGELVPIQENTMNLTERAQANTVCVVAGVVGATAGYAVGVIVTSVGGGPVEGVVARTATTIVVEISLESGMEWLIRNAASVRLAILRALNGMAQLDHLQRDYREACRIFRRNNSHDEAMRLSSSLRADYCMRFPHWQDYFR